MTTITATTALGHISRAGGAILWSDLVRRIPADRRGGLQTVLNQLVADGQVSVADTNLGGRGRTGRLIQLEKISVDQVPACITGPEYQALCELAGERGQHVRDLVSEVLRRELTADLL